MVLHIEGIQCTDYNHCVGPADRLMIYLILFISECLTKIAPTPGKPSPNYQEATKVLSTLAVDHFALPGEAGFPLNSLYHAPGSRADAGRSWPSLGKVLY
jgi:actin related protein 2/3 complex subunit 3